MTDTSAHICQPAYRHLADMKAFYSTLGALATSTNADIVLIRSHIAYWSGEKAAERAVIKPSRGHSYRVNGDTIVRIADHWDHREGVTGYRF